MPIDFPLTNKRKKTHFTIFSRVPKKPKCISIDTFEPDLNLSKTTIYDNLQFLIKLDAVTREKRAGGIYYYCAMIDKKNFELKLREKKCYEGMIDEKRGIEEKCSRIYQLQGLYSRIDGCIGWIARFNS